MRKVAVLPAGAAAEHMADAAFEAVWQAHGEELRRRCRCWMGDADLGEEAFCRAAILALEKYGHHANTIADTRSWLIAVVHNVCMNFHRERKRDRFVLLDTIDPRRLATRGNPEKDMIRGELTTLLRRAVEELPPRLRIPLELVVYEERSYREVARLLDVTEPSLRKRLQQARTRLHARLRAYDKGRPPRDARAEHRAPAPAARYLVIQWVVCPDGTRVHVERFTDELPSVRGELSLRRLERYVARHATGWRLRVRFARALLAAGQTEAAIAQYRIALARRPDRTMLALELAAILRACGDEDEARSLRARIADASPDAILFDAHEALRAGRFAEAIARLEPLADGGDAMALTLLADAWLACGVPARAEACLAAAGATAIVVLNSPPAE